MIKTFVYNAVNFSTDFIRTSKYFDPNLQRKRNIIAPVTGVLSFEFIPGAMPPTAPTATLTTHLSNGTTVQLAHTNVVTLTNSYIYRFNISSIGLIAGNCDFFVTVEGYTDIIFSEKCEAYELADCSENNLKRVIAYNNDDTRGYISSTYPACGFFHVSELNRDQFGNDKVEYKMSRGRTMILDSDNYIKTNLTFIGLSMYQQNLLKWLCNCHVTSINGVTYYLLGELKEERKDTSNEICDLQGTFIAAGGELSTFAATEAAQTFEPTNLFM